MAPADNTPKTGDSGHPGPLTGTEIRHVLGDVMDAKVAAILRIGATREDLDAAIAWLAGDTETLSESGHPLSGKAAEIYDVLTTEELWPEDVPEEEV
jgi:hypothetical protein